MAFSLLLIHSFAYGVTSLLASREHTSTTLFLRHNDVASYLDMTFALHMHYSFGLTFMTWTNKALGEVARSNAFPMFGGG